MPRHPKLVKHSSTINVFIYAFLGELFCHCHGNPAGLRYGTGYDLLDMLIYRKFTCWFFLTEGFFIIWCLMFFEFLKNGVNLCQLLRNIADHRKTVFSHLNVISSSAMW